MNERIRQLAEQAKAESNQWLGSKPAITVTHDELERFGELIVEKCAGIIESQDVDPSFKLRMSWAVKQYFGVEQ